MKPHQPEPHWEAEEKPLRLYKEPRGLVEVWRSIAIALAGMLATGLAAWLTFGPNRVTREEMRQETEQIRTTAERLTRQLQDLTIEQTKIGTKLDQIITEVQELRKKK